MFQYNLVSTGCYHDICYNKFLRVHFLRHRVEHSVNTGVKWNNYILNQKVLIWSWLEVWIIDLSCGSLFWHLADDRNCIEETNRGLQYLPETSETTVTWQYNFPLRPRPIILVSSCEFGSNLSDSYGTYPS